MDKEYTPGQSSLAWYKLAELITRGEKEKVLNFYRLLSHSFAERAYALQVEGDILWAFADKGSLEKYEQAVYLYQRDNKLPEAIALCEHMLQLEPTRIATIMTLLFLTIATDSVERFETHWKHLVSLWQKRDVPQAVMERAVLRVAAELDARDEIPGRRLTRAYFAQLASTTDERLGRYAGRALQR